MMKNLVLTTIAALLIGLSTQAQTLQSQRDNMETYVENSFDNLLKNTMTVSVTWESNTMVFNCKVTDSNAERATNDATPKFIFQGFTNSWTLDQTKDIKKTLDITAIKVIMKNSQGIFLADYKGYL